MNLNDVTAISVGVLLGLGVLLAAGPTGLAVAALVGTGVLLVRAQLGRLTPAHGATTTSLATEPRRPAPPPTGEVRPVREMSDEELCWAWRTSYALLQRDPTTAGRVSLLRATYLDELQRRDPDGFDAWMSSGARAASNPAPFLSPRRSP